MAPALLAFWPVRILVDYRPALKERTGVGEYVHELAAALARRLEGGDRLVLFTSSWADRPSADLAVGWPRTEVLDRRWPVRPLTYGWNRLSWPPVELLAGPADIVHSPAPLLIPARRARQVITVHDLDFLAHPERASAEMRRDYPALVRKHSALASLVVVNSEDTARAVQRELAVTSSRIVLCRPGVPSWIGRPSPATPPAGGYVLFVGTLEPRKNLGVLLDAWERLTRSEPALPRLRVVGGVKPGGEEWVRRMSEPPLAGRVDYIGYVDAVGRRALYAGARILVLPSLHEGFGLPVLEAMALGVPVITSDRGALPEVAGDAGVTVKADDAAGLAAAIAGLLADPAKAAQMSRRGVELAATFNWDTAAAALYDAYQRLMAA
jgi:glycosyltransferase involved in cell wall biosynthesis